MGERLTSIHSHKDVDNIIHVFNKCIELLLCKCQDLNWKYREKTIQVYSFCPQNACCQMKDKT